MLRAGFQGHPPGARTPPAAQCAYLPSTQTHHLPNFLYRLLISAWSASVFWGLFSISYRWNISLVATGSMKSQLPIDAAAATASVLTALAGAAATPPCARYREPNSTRLQPVVSAKYLATHTQTQHSVTQAKSGSQTGRRITAVSIFSTQSMS